MSGSVGSSSYDDMIEKDLELLWVINDYISATPWLNDFFSKIISKYPWKDIVVIVWCFFVIGISEIGRNHFWVVVMNLIFAITLRRIVEAKRPIEYDNRLQPLTDKSSESYGFPSLETYMSVVVMGHLFLSLKSLTLLPIGVLVCFIVGVSRIFSRARFPHQIVGSWALGFLGLIVSMHCCEKMSFHKMSKHDHGVCVVFMIVCGIANLGLAMENNDSRLLHVPKKEFIRVMSEIVSGTGNADAGENENEGEEADTPDMIYTLNEEQQIEEESVGLSFSQFGSKRSKNRVPDSPRTLATKQAQLFSDASSGPSSGNSTPKTGSITKDAPSPRITTLTARSFTSRAGSVLTQRTAGRSANTTTPTVANKFMTVRKGKIKSDSLYYLQKSMQERETILKNSESSPLNTGRSKLMYGKEDFFSSDTDTAISNGKAV